MPERRVRASEKKGGALSINQEGKRGGGKACFKNGCVEEEAPRRGPKEGNSNPITETKRNSFLLKIREDQGLDVGEFSLCSGRRN